MILFNKRFSGLTEKLFSSKLWCDNRGGTAVEFALVLPWFIFAMFAMFDLSLEYFAQSALDLASQNAARYIKINAQNTVAQSTMNAGICDDLSWLVKDCTLIQTYVTTSASYAALQPTVLNSNGNLSSTSFVPGLTQTPTLIQVAYKRPFYLMPLSGQSATPTLTSTLVFRNE